MSTRVFLALAMVGCVASTSKADYGYCVVGAGPSGVQSAYFLLKRQVDFVVFERGPGVGTFFEYYPRHRNLISINKRYTGKGGERSEQFNLRHDWNSLLSDDKSLKFGKYSHKYFASAALLPQYLNEFVTKTGLLPHIRFNSTVRVRRVAGSALFQIAVDETGERVTCRTVISAQGLWKIHRPRHVGFELAEEYQTMSTNLSNYVNQTIAILGNGNAAFETANAIFNVTKQVHIIGRRPLRFSWQTHYAGDVRAVNSAHLDRYQLVGGTDTVMEMNPLPKLVKDPSGGVILVPPWAKDPTPDNLNALEAWKQMPADASLSDKIEAYNNGARGYKDLGWMHVDRVLACLGWRFDATSFPEGEPDQGTETALPELYFDAKYPKLKANFESVNQKDLYFAGGLTHGRDFRKASGAFIHGFRYNCRALDKWLAVKYEADKWHAEMLYPLRPMLMADRVLGSANNGDGIYQMFGQMVDVFTVTMNSGGELVGRHFKEIPKQLADDLTREQFRFTLDLRYGLNFTGPTFDVFSLSRVTNNPADAHLSNFLHPVIQMFVPGSTEPVHVFHVLEDLRTEFILNIHLSPTIDFFKTVWPSLPGLIRQHLSHKAQKADATKCAATGTCGAQQQPKASTESTSASA